METELSVITVIRCCKIHLPLVKNRKMEVTSAGLRKSASSPWPMIIVLNTLPQDCVGDWQSIQPEIESKAATKRIALRLRPGLTSIEEKWNKFDLPPLDQFKRNRLQPITSIEIELEKDLSQLNDSMRNIFDTTFDLPLCETSPTEPQNNEQQHPSTDHRCSQPLVKAERDAEGCENFDTSNAAIHPGNRFNMPVAREVLPSQETICEEDINLTKPFTEQLLDDSDEDIFLEINRTPETIQAATPPTRYGYSGVTSDTTGLHGSPIARSSPFIPNMMLRSPSIFARLTTDLQVPRLNLQRLRLSGKTLFSQKHLLDDMEDAGPSHAHRPASGRSIDDDDDDSVIGLRRPGKVRRIADTQSDAIEQHDAANEHRTVSPGNLKKIVREFICAEAEASDDCEMETEEEESNEEDDSFIVRDSQIEEAKPVSYERAMYLRSVRDLPRAGAFYFPDRQQRPPALSPWASPISDSIDSQQDTYDQSFLDEDAKADSHLSVLEQLEAKLEKTKAPKRTTPCSWN